MTSLGNIQQIRRQTEEIKTLKAYLFDNTLAAKPEYKLTAYLNNTRQNRDAPVFLDTRDPGEDIEVTYENMLRRLQNLIQQRDVSRRTLMIKKSNHPIGINRSIRNKTDLVNSFTKLPHDVSKMISEHIKPSNAAHRATASHFLTRRRATVARGRRHKHHKTHRRHHKRKSSRSR